ncbi:BTAD domain-containing putative transcriptional regulator [Streptomyces niveus]|uniref:BTAD domain-containing putative transcriptional regulator n=1 Tax=Streptomyces niveus TaxID=193462 RepID=UPI0034241FE5
MDGEPPLRVALLGVFQVSRGGAALPVAGARLRSLVVRLALAGGRTVTESALVDAVWGEDPPAGPAHALHSLVSRLRRALGSADVVALLPGGYRLALDADDVDVLRFERLVATGRDRLRAGDPLAGAAVLGEAVALWGERPGGEPGAVAEVAPAAATRLAQLSVEAVADLAEAELDLGRTEEAAARLTALLADHPVHERAVALLMDALDAQGRQAEALARYERVRETIADVLGADPGAALRERHLRLLRAERPAPVADPVRRRPGNLPAPVTSFIGRDADLARIDTLLASGRLVTVLGPGGAGKTRLAVEAARRRRDRDTYRDGVWLIDLAPVTDPAKVGAAVLAGTPPRAGTMFQAAAQPRSGTWVDGGDGDELDVLVDQLGFRQSLLLVDNCEHLVDAVARLFAALLSRCPGLRVLTTSREPLAIDGEALVPLGPLALPGPDDGVEQARLAASVRLFSERAAVVRPDFDVDATTLPDVLRLVRGLDGLPLALELAAARLRTLSLPELADGLSDRFRLLTTGSRAALPRHRTLRAVIAWSWELLGEHERTVAERVSVLPGGVTPASATALCAGTEVPAARIPDLLAALVDRSLLHLAPDPGRYRMLETLREYGTDRLAASGDLGTVRDLSAGHFAELTARHDPLLRGPGQLAAMRVIGAEYANTLAALRHRCDTGDAAGAVALALSLTWYWQLFGRHTDAAYWLSEVLAVPGAESAPGRDLARATHLLHRVDTRRGMTAEEAADDRAGLRELAGRLLAQPEPAGPYGALVALQLAALQEEKSALAVFGRWADGDDVWLSGLAHMLRAEYAENTGRLDRMRADVDAALHCFRQAGDRWGQATTLTMRAQVRQYDDDLDGALADLRESWSLADEFGRLSPADELFRDLRRIDLRLRRGDTGTALALLDSARERAPRVVSEEMLVLLDALEAGFRVRLGDLDRARGLLDDAERALRGEATFPGDHVRTLLGNVRASLCLELGDPAGAARALTTAYAAALATRDVPILAVVAVTTAALAEAYGRPHESAVLLGAAARLRGAHDPTDPQVRELTARGRAALGEEAFAAAYATGGRLDRAAATAEVDPARYAAARYPAR